MQTLLAVIVAWLSANYALAPPEKPPRIEFVDAARMTVLRNERMIPADRHTAPADSAMPLDGEHGVYAYYDDLSSTIYLPEQWTATSPSQVSILVHELVHHLQNGQRMRFACAAERETLAYRAQSAWLELFGTSLEDAFDIDPMTLLVRTNCLY